MATVFYSWQADTSTLVGRNLIERALEKALGELNKGDEVEEAQREELAVDRDTMGVAGSPPIVQTIFDKIDRAAVFVPDLTFVGKRLDDRPTPNPNVLIEYGWALKSLTHSRIVPVMNVAFGAPSAEAMPFDMRHLRNPITYDCPPNADEQTRRAVKAGLAKKLRSAIAEVLQSDTYLASMPRSPEPVPFTRRPSVSSPGRFAAAGEEIGVRERYPGVSDFIAVEAGPVIWLRLIPQHTQDDCGASPSWPPLTPRSRSCPSIGLSRVSVDLAPTKLLAGTRVRERSLPRVWWRRFRPERYGRWTNTGLRHSRTRRPEPCRL